MENKQNLFQVTLRLATTEDIHHLFKWRNSIVVREYSFNTHKIAWNDHKNWFNENLGKDNCYILIGEFESKPIGVLRYKVDSDQAEINVYLAPKYIGKGLGTKLLISGIEWLQVNLPQVKKIIACVVSTNIRSQKAFIKAGYEEYYKVFKYNLS